MPTRNVNLTPELDQFIASKVESGLYSNASEVMRAALRLLKEDEVRIAALRAEIDKGFATTSPRLLSESLRILKERQSRVTLDDEFGNDLEKIIQSHADPLNPPAWD